MIKFHHRLVRKIIRIKERFSFFLIKIKYESIGQIKLARTAKIDSLALLDISPETSANYLIEIDENTHIKKYAQLLARGGFIRIGKRCAINPFCMIYGYGGVIAGNPAGIIKQF